MTATMPGISTTLQDSFSALQVASDVYTDRIVIVARTGPAGEISATYAHTYDAKKYVNLADVATVHGVSSELYEAFYHAQYAGCVDIWLCPIPFTSQVDRETDLNTAYDTLYVIRPSILVPYGRGAQIDVDANGVATRSVPISGSPDYADGAYADSGDFLEDLATACAALSEGERTCIGIIGCSALADITPSGNITSFGTEAAPGTLFDDIPTPDEFAEPDNGKFVNVVVAEVETAGMGPWAWRRGGGATTYFRSNGALNYAGLITKLSVVEAPTGKTVSGISNIAYKLSRNQTLAAISKSVVTFGVLNGIVRVDDAMTYAPEGSDYQRLSTVRICAVVDEMVRTIGSKFIGRGMSLDTRNSFVTNLSSGFDNLLSSGVILDADFRVKYDGPNYTAYVNVVVVPAWELRRIVFTVAVTFQGINASRVL